ncbi:MAG: glycoside hydrolase family 88 protein [Dehalococcoidia bacterium]
MAAKTSGLLYAIAPATPFERAAAMKEAATVTTPQRMTRTRVLEVMSLAADRALEYPYKIWGYGEGPALRAVLLASQTLDRPALADAVADLVTASLAAAADEETDHLIPVEVLLELRRLRPGIDVCDAVDRFTAAVAHAARPILGQPQVHRPHHPSLGRLIWVDCLHTDAPGLALTGQSTLATEVTLQAVQALQDDTGLFSHGYHVDTGMSSAIHWARGQGWALYGLVGLLTLAPSAAGVLLGSLQRLLQGLSEHERNGRWSTIVDDPHSPAEASLSPITATTLHHGIAAGFINPRWRDLADRALNATLDAVTGKGELLVSEATPVGDAATYYNRRSGVFPWGQGPLIDALHTALSHATAATSSTTPPAPPRQGATS